MPTSDATSEIQLIFTDSPTAPNLKTKADSMLKRYTEEEADVDTCNKQATEAPPPAPPLGIFSPTIDREVIESRSLKAPPPAPPLGIFSPTIDRDQHLVTSNSSHGAGAAQAPRSRKSSPSKIAQVFNKTFGFRWGGSGRDVRARKIATQP